MSIEILLILAFIILVLVLLVKSLLVVQENQRVVVIKLGKIERVLGPGLCFVLPFVDIPVLVNLDAHVSNWPALSSEELNVILISMVRQNPNPKAYR
jgi:regulator of protease activity HflC (stomatin/prohibitin superfamily)